MVSYAESRAIVRVLLQNMSGDPDKPIFVAIYISCRMVRQVQCFFKSSLKYILYLRLT